MGSSGTFRQQPSSPSTGRWTGSARHASTPPASSAACSTPSREGTAECGPAGTAYTTKQLYLPDTAILLTRFLSEDGVGEVCDFMPVEGHGTATERHRLIRMIRCVRGRMTFEVSLAPRFDYGREPHEVEVSEAGAVFRGSTTSLVAHVVREPGDARLARGDIERGDLHGWIDVEAGDVRGIVLETGTSGPAHEVRPHEVEELFQHTTAFWQSWVARSTYTGRWREAVHRSAITLKLLTYAPTGALIAAPTAGLPEQVGGERNWDYRYTWVRDASFSVRALLSLGFREEAAAFALWLRDRVHDQPSDAAYPLDIMYRVDGARELVEEELDHWEGYRGSRPVRIGNAAAEQLQLDIYGEAMDSLHVADQHGLHIGHLGWTEVAQVLDWLADSWDQPDEGIWETRGGRKDFTYSRLMCWVALDRGIRLAEERGRPAPVDRWREQRDAIYTQVFEQGWSSERSAFVQQYGDTVLDSALLRMPSVGFVTPYDPMWLATLDAMAEELVSDSLVYRYDPAASPDGLAGDEGTFSLCTFAYVDALARAGRTAGARLTFEKMLTYANHVGLHAEEISATGEQLGNFPQAFTHLALIEAAVTLDAALGGAHVRRPTAGPIVDT